jgi:lauroyl/myristoyl acyltransferase
MRWAVADLNTLDDEAIFVDFFGVPAATTFVIAKLAVRTNTPLVPSSRRGVRKKESIC